MFGIVRTLVGRVACGLAALTLGLTPAAGAAPVPMSKPEKKDSTKKDEPAKGADPRPAPAFGGVFDPEQAARIQEEMGRQMLEARRRMLAGFSGAAGEGRLGVAASPPSATLADQLDLPRGQGLVLEEVEPGSAAAKAGLKPHDILLELNGKTVPDDIAELSRQLQDIKAGTAVDAVVLRKGKLETIKGLKLPEAPAAVRGLGNAPAPFRFPVVPVVPRLVPMAVVDGPGGVVLLTTSRTGDRFTTRYQEGTLAIRVTGTVAGGKAKVSAIDVEDGAKSDHYESVDKVPARYRDKVKELAEASAKGGVLIDTRAP
jgi:membrane-associated protease RseP (regulator of RpoE activity)